MPCATPTVEPFFHAATNTITFVVSDPATKDAVVIDPVMDLDVVNWQVSQEHNDKVVEYVKTAGLKVHWILETHVHADHLSGAARLRDEFPGAQTGIGSRIVEVQATFAALFGLEGFACDGSQWSKLFQDKEAFEAGSLKFEVWHTPGHTPACCCFIAGDAVFTGDLIFTEDFGCGRCDFPGGCAGDMFDSVMRVYTLPDDMRVFVGHDYQPGGRDLRVQSTIKLEKEKQEDLPASASNMRDEFVKGKTGYDKTLNLPKLIFPALLVNIRAGHLPPPAANGHRYLSVPLNTRTPTDDAGRVLKPAA